MLLVPLSPNKDINLSQVGGAAVSLGQKLSSASIPVVVASDQSAVEVSLKPSGTGLAVDNFSNYAEGVISIGYDQSYGLFGTLPLSSGGMTVPVEVLNSISTYPYLSSAVVPARGKIVAGALTGSYASLLVMGGNAVAAVFSNSTDQDVLISYDNGTTDHLELAPGETVFIDFQGNGRVLASNTIKAKYVSAGPSIGSVRAAVFR